MRRQASKKSSLAFDLRRDGACAALCALFDGVDGAQFWIKDRAGRYLWANRGFLLNYALDRREQVVGKTDYDLSPRHLADQFRQDDERVLAGCAIANRIERVGRFDHTTPWNVTHKIPLRNRRGRVVATAGITVPLRGRHDVEHEGLGAGMGKVVSFVREHYAEALANEDLAQMANLSVRAFERHFRSHFQLSPRQYIRRLRVRLACQALVQTDLPLARIAGDCGFCDQSHFTREFRRETGDTPRRYRARYRLTPA